MSKAGIIASGNAALTLITSLNIPDRSTSQSRADRRGLKRAVNAPVSILDFAAPGTSEWTQAFTDAFAELGAQTDRRLYCPAGDYPLANALTMDYPIDLFGDHMSRTTLRATHTGVILTITGKYGTGPRVHDLTLGFDQPSGVAGAHLVASTYQNVGTPTDHYSPDFLSLINLNLTCYNNKQASYNVKLDGSARVNDVGGTVPIGLRNIFMQNIQAFNASFRGLDINHVRVGEYFGLNFYGGNGVAGAATYAPSGKLCYDNKFFGCTINGTFGISDSDATQLYGTTTTVSLGANVTNDKNV